MGVILRLDWRVTERRKEVRRMAGKKSGGPYRSAKTGRYVTEKYGKAHPNTTVREAAPKKK